MHRGTEHVRTRRSRLWALPLAATLAVPAVAAIHPESATAARPPAALKLPAPLSALLDSLQRAGVPTCGPCAPDPGPSADIRLSVSNDGGTPGATEVWVIHNAGPNAATGAELRLQVSPAMSVDSFRIRTAGCLVDNAAETVTCGLGTLAVGATRTVTFNDVEVPDGSWKVAGAVTSQVPDPTPWSAVAVDVVTGPTRR